MTGDPARSDPAAPDPGAPAPSSPGPETCQVEGPRSVLATLLARGRACSRVILRDETGEEGDAVRTRAGVSLQPDQGRYQVLGEIARGGVGVILKGRDVDLGRDVAMKVLRDEHAGNEDVVQRFVEEAQIGGQLQHPGIAPVYEMGIQANGRPFFTMKLIKGRTLAALLAERRNPADDRGRFLGVFEAACQTLAYAHARGVVHRDLKPSNIMVGSFGEVQVVDWGLAKVLAEGGVADDRRTRTSAKPNLTVIATVRSGSPTSHSMVGSVMGTPAYMPPEQARGEVELLDQRSDVFSLGAILCEILTGMPPYVGSDDEMVAHAARADLTDARGRLAGCGADPALLRIAEACLSPAPAGRPRDAGELSKEVAGALARTEEETRRAQSEASATLVREREAKRAHRLVMGLAASVLAAVAVAGGGFLWVRNAGLAREARVQEDVDRALEETATLRGQVAAGANPGAWKEVLQAAERARSLAASADAPEAARQAADRALAELRDEEAAARRIAESLERDRRTVELLDEIRLEAWDLDPGMKEARYGAAFLACGIDVEHLPAAAAAGAVHDSAIRVRLATALDSWAADRKAAGLPEGNLAIVARTADDDPWRTRLREARSLEDLHTLAASADAEALPVESLALLARSLAAAGDQEGAVALGERILEAHPDDLWTLTQVAVWMIRLPVARLSDAIRYARAAVALRPESSGAWANAAAVLEAAKDTDGFREAVAAALRLNPDNPTALVYRGRALNGERKYAEAEEALRRAITLRADLAEAHSSLSYALFGLRRHGEGMAEAKEGVRLEQRSSRAHASLGNLYASYNDYVAARAEFREAVRLDPTNEMASLSLSSTLVNLQDLDGALEQARELVRLYPAHVNSHFNLATILDTMGDLESALRSYEAARRLVPLAGTIYFRMGSIRFSLGDLDGAERDLRTSIILSQNAGASLVLAQVLLARGDLEGALKAARELVRTSPSRSAWILLAQSLMAQGQYTRAAGDLGNAANASQEPLKRFLTEQADLIRRLGPRQEDLLAGRLVPGTASEWLEWGDYLVYARRFARCAEMAVPFLAQDPSRAEERRVSVLTKRYSFTCAAALTAGGRGVDAADLDAAGRSRMRGLALEWLRADRALLVEAFRKDPPRFAQNLRAFLNHIVRDQDLFAVRGTAALAALPPAEREAWRTFWEENATLAREARGAITTLLTGGAESLPTLTAVVNQPEMSFESTSDMFPWLNRIARIKGRPWGPEQAAGPPDAPPAGTYHTCWMPEATEKGEITLELDFARPVEPTGIRILQTSGAGTVTRVEARRTDGTWTSLWSGAAPGGAAAPFEPPLAPCGFPCGTIRITMDPKLAKAVTAIDAVELVAGDDHQWATAARASSTVQWY